MTNPHGFPIWYELLTPDHAAARHFYEAVIGWKIEGQPTGPIDYRMIAAADGAVGGVMEVTEAMTAGGAKPGWLTYLAADDVDATADRVAAAGGTVLMPPFDLPGVGRMAFCADPQGAPFYLMRGSMEGDSNSFAPGTPGHGAWHELWTTDAAGALAFYERVFGWTNPDTMPVGPQRGYHFVHVGATALGAIGQSREPDRISRWTFYFQVSDLDTAIERVRTQGGRIDEGPHEVPGGSRVVVGRDPHGATFALVAPPKED